MSWYLEDSETHHDLEGNKVTYVYGFEGLFCTLAVIHDDHIVKVELPRTWRITTADKLSLLVSAYEGEMPSPPVNWETAPAWANFCTSDRNGARNWWDMHPMAVRETGKWENEDATVFPVTLFRHWRAFIEERPNPNAQDEQEAPSHPVLEFDDFLAANQAEYEAARQRRRREYGREENVPADYLAGLAVNNNRHLYINELPVDEEAVELAAAQQVAAPQGELPWLPVRDERPNPLADTIMNLAERSGGALRNLSFHDLLGVSVLVYVHDNMAITPITYWHVIDGRLTETHDNEVIVQVLDRLQRVVEVNRLNGLELPPEIRQRAHEA